MPVGRKEDVTKMAKNRDIEADYKAALLREYESYRSAGLDDAAKAVATELRNLGHDVRPKPSAETKEKAVDPTPVERAVEKDEPQTKRPVGRPAKNTNDKESGSK
jgi:hypothetical protein